MVQGFCCLMKYGMAFAILSGGSKLVQRCVTNGNGAGEED